jgi:hypothetical protein
MVNYSKDAYNTAILQHLILRAIGRLLAALKGEKSPEPGFIDPLAFTEAQWQTCLHQSY